MVEFVRGRPVERATLERVLVLAVVEEELLAEEETVEFVRGRPDERATLERVLVLAVVEEGVETEEETVEFVRGRPDERATLERVLLLAVMFNGWFLAGWLEGAWLVTVVELLPRLPPTGETLTVLVPPTASVRPERRGSVSENGLGVIEATEVAPL